MAPKKKYMTPELRREAKTLQMRQYRKEKSLKMLVREDFIRAKLPFALLSEGGENDLDLFFTDHIFRNGFPGYFDGWIDGLTKTDADVG